MKNCAYSRVAFNVLVKMNNYSEDQAREAVETLSVEQFSKLTYGKTPSLMVNGMLSICESLGLNETETMQLCCEWMGETVDTNMTDKVREQLSHVMKMQSGRELIDKMAMDALTVIHDMSVFHDLPTHSELYKLLPIETQGWHEAKGGLMYVGPILESIGVTIDEQTLRQEYTKRSIEKLSGLDLREAILDGFNGYDKNWSCGSYELHSASYVDDMVLPNIEKKGFGKDEVLMAELDARGANPIKSKSDMELELDTPGNR